MIETDMLYAYVKKEDWLKETAKNIIARIIKGEFGQVFASRETLHEIYYVSKEEALQSMNLSKERLLLQQSEM